MDGDTRPRKDENKEIWRHYDNSEGTIPVIGQIFYLVINGEDNRPSDVRVKLTHYGAIAETFLPMIARTNIETRTKAFEAAVKMLSEKLRMTGAYGINDD